MGLDELGAGADLFGQPQNTVEKGVGKGIRRGADKKIGRLGEGLPSQDAPCPASPGRPEQLDGVEVEDPFGLGLIPEGLVIAAQTEDVADPEGRGAQNVGLEGNAVSVAGDHLEHRVEPFLAEQGTGRQTAQADHPGLIVRHIHAVHKPWQKISLLPDSSGSAPFGGPHSAVTAK